MLRPFHKSLLYQPVAAACPSGGGGGGFVGSGFVQYPIPIDCARRELIKIAAPRRWRRGAVAIDPHTVFSSGGWVIRNRF